MNETSFCNTRFTGFISLYTVNTPYTEWEISFCYAGYRKERTRWSQFSSPIK